MADILHPKTRLRRCFWPAPLKEKLSEKSTQISDKPVREKVPKLEIRKSLR